MRPKRANPFGMSFPVAVGISLILAALFLFNPYFTIYGSGTQCAMDSPMSHRGTVAASELRRSRVSNEKISVRIVAVAIALLPVTACDFRLPRWAEVGEPQQLVDQNFSASMWFRPPPVS